MQLIRALIAWTYLFTYALAYIVFTILTFKQFNKRLLPGITRFWARSIFKILGIKINLIDTEPFLEQKPRIVTFNHQSALDILCISAIVPPGTMVIAKKEFKLIPVINLAFWISDVHYIDRSSREQSIRSLNMAGERVAEESLSLFISPEGTRTRTGDLLPFKKGAFHLASKINVPIYPMLISGAFQLMPKGKLIPKRGEISVKCLPAQEAPKDDNIRLDQWMNQVRDLMQSELKALQSQP